MVRNWIVFVFSLGGAYFGLYLERIWDVIGANPGPTLQKWGVWKYKFIRKL